MAKHGAPDWYKYRRESITFPMDDLAELAPRIGSIVTFDRRGDVIFTETFKDGPARWETADYGGGGTYEITPTAFRYDGYSWLLQTVAATGNTLYTHCDLTYTAAPRLGVELCFYHDTTDKDLSVWLYIYDGSQEHIACVRYRSDAETLSLRDKTGTFQAFATSLLVHSGTRLFHFLKFVYDISTEDYVRCMLDENEWDISAYSGAASADATGPFVLIGIGNVARADAASKVYLDGIILTQDEP